MQDKITKPHLTFIIDQDYDARMIFEMLKDSKGEKLHLQSRRMGLTNDVASKIRGHSWAQTQKPITAIVRARYRAVGKRLVEMERLYQKSWGEINDRFFVAVEKRTGFSWEYPKYQCVISLFHPGISNWNGNVIARIWSENPYTMRKITAHELIITHIFSVLQRGAVQDNKLSDRQKWAIAEIAAWCLTGFEKKLLAFWPWIHDEQRFPTHHNYPELVGLQKRIGASFQKEKSFHVWLQKAAASVKRKI